MDIPYYIYISIFISIIYSIYILYIPYINYYNNIYVYRVPHIPYIHIYYIYIIYRYIANVCDYLYIPHSPPPLKVGFGESQTAARSFSWSGLGSTKTHQIQLSGGEENGEYKVTIHGMYVYIIYTARYKTYTYTYTHACAQIMETNSASSGIDLTAESGTQQHMKTYYVIFRLSSSP